MNKKSLSQSALQIIEAYTALKVGNATTGVPYYNNKTSKKRGSLRTYIGKGSAKDIEEEIRTLLVKQHISLDTLTSETLKKIMVDNDLGLDCSAFAYYILDEEGHARGLGHMNKHMNFLRGRNPMAKMISYLRPVENSGVKTFASDTNSLIVNLHEVQPGDFISMVDGPDGQDRNHILIITAVEYEGSTPKKISYSHAIAYPEDGLYGTGIKNGEIDIVSPQESITNQTWSESGSPEKARIIFARAQASKTELRRLKWFS